MKVKIRYAAILGLILAVLCGCSKQGNMGAVEVLQSQGLEDPVNVFSIQPNGTSGGNRDVTPEAKELGFTHMADAAYLFGSEEDALTAGNNYLDYLGSKGLTKSNGQDNVYYNDNIYALLYAAKGSSGDDGQQKYTLFVRVGYKQGK